MPDITSSSHRSVSKSPIEYYAQFADSCPGLAQKFRDIDQSIYYNESKILLLDPNTQNFVVDFGNDDAWCAVNLEKTEVERLIDSEVSSRSSRG